CLDLSSEAEKSLDRDDEWSRVGRGPVCASWPAVVSTQRWSLIGWEGPPNLAWEVGCWKAFIAIVTGYPHMKPLFSLLLTIPLHLVTPSVVLAARRAPAAEGCRPSHLTCVRSAVRSLTPPCLCQAGFPV
ncbi:hypothetical protein BHM03_00058091, partial [Ensete ventricosum]